jgi:hypothetical protein
MGLKDKNLDEADYKKHIWGHNTFESSCICYYKIYNTQQKNMLQVMKALG